MPSRGPRAVHLDLSWCCGGLYDFGAFGKEDSRRFREPLEIDLDLRVTSGDVVPVVIPRQLILKAMLLQEG